jgi:hypothetical protein
MAFHHDLVRKAIEAKLSDLENPDFAKNMVMGFPTSDTHEWGKHALQYRAMLENIKASRSNVSMTRVIMWATVFTAVATIANVGVYIARGH